MLLTFSFSIGAEVIYKTFLFHGGKKTTANITLHESSKRVKVLFVTASVFSVNDILNPIKKFLGNYGLVTPLVILSVKANNAVVESVLKHGVNSTLEIFLSAS